ncbi:MAG: tetratricopeptide repeat protein [bacterium]
MKILVRNYLIGTLIFILLLCAVHLPFSTQYRSIDISYPADNYFKDGLVLLSHDSLTNAVKAFTSAITYQPAFAPFHYYLALTYERQEEYERAIAEYNVVIKIDPEFYPAFYNLGNIMGHNKEYDQAISLLRRAVQLNPYYINAFMALADIYTKTGDHASAEKIFNYLKYIGYDK